MEEGASVNVGQDYTLNGRDTFAVSLTMQLCSQYICVLVQIRAAIGDAASRYYIAVDEDPHLRVS